MHISTTTVRGFQDELNKIAIAYDAKHLVRAAAAGTVIGAVGMHEGKKALDNYRVGRAYAKAQREQGG